MQASEDLSGYKFLVGAHPAKLSDICSLGHSGLICCSFGTSLRIYKIIESKIEEMYTIKNEI